MSRLCFALLLSCSVALAARSSGGGSYGRGGGGNYGGRGGGGYGTQSHSYPQSPGYSGNRPSGQTHSYPSSNGMSGNRNTGQSYHRTEVHHHYHYNPPQQIHYGNQHLPVYQHTPPVYVYEYRNSGSRFDTLLTGLALYNLGRMSSHHDRYDDRYRDYRSNSGETCKLGVSKTNGEYEESRIDCKLMSSFIWDADQSKSQDTNGNKKITTNTVTTVTNVTHLNLNTSDSDNSTRNEGVTVTVTNTTTVVDALQVKGPSIEVKPGMNCYMIRISVDSSIFKRKVDCGILQSYAVQSLHTYNKAVCFTSVSTFTMTMPLLMFYIR